jgi:hypothetical protein
MIMQERGVEGEESDSRTQSRVEEEELKQFVVLGTVGVARRVADDETKTRQAPLRKEGIAETDTHTHTPHLHTHRQRERERETNGVPYLVSY